MVVRMRHTKSQRGNTRSHHALVVAPKTLCKDCGSPKPPHLVCTICGKYKGRQVLDVHAKVDKKAKKTKEKEKQASK